MLKERNSMMSPGSPCGDVSGVVTGTATGSVRAGTGTDAGATCAGCGGRIHDRYYLLAVDRQWHSPCLKCCECKLPLDSELTCFARDGNIYCKEDYYRMFAVKRCGRCQAGISASELVMRVRDVIYHLNCFTCALCAIPLSKGDHFGMRDGLVYCRPHYELLLSGDYCDSMEIGSMFRTTGSPALQYHMSPSPASVQKGRPRKRKIPPGSESPGSTDLTVANMRMNAGALEQPPVVYRTKPRLKCRSRKGLLRFNFWKRKMLHPGDLSSSMESLSYDSSSVASPGSGSGHTSQRTKRMRTSFKHHQLRTMKSYFAINQNPDAKDLKQLAQKTGLSKRVLQVWFQNARAKWRRNLMRQEGSQAPPGTPGQQPGGGNGPPSVGPPSAAMLGDSNSLPHAPSLDEMHHHLHGQGSQSITFGDLY